MACTYISSTCVCTSVKMCHSSRSIERRKRMKATAWTRTHPCRLLLVLPLRLVVHQKVDEGSAEEGGNHRPNPRKYHRRQTGEEVTEPKHQLAGVVGVANFGVQPGVTPTVRDDIVRHRRASFHIHAYTYFHAPIGLHIHIHFYEPPFQNKPSPVESSRAEKKKKKIKEAT